MRYIEVIYVGTVIFRIGELEAVNQSRIVIEGFTRQETLKLTGCTSSRLSYLEKVGLIVPTRVGNNTRPTVLFTWEQLLEIKAIKELRKDVSLQTVRKIVEFLNENGYDDSLRDKQLIVLDDEVFWVSPDWSDLPTALRVASKSSKGVGQYILFICPPFADIVSEIWDAAKENSNVVNFEDFKRRAKARPA